MFRPLLGIVLLLCAIGCQQTGRRLLGENPVLGPPPPRVPLTSDSEGGSEIELAAHQQGQGDDSEAPILDTLDETIVATVGGDPVFAADVLRPYRPFIETQKQKIQTLDADARKMARAQFEEETQKLLAQTLNDFLDREVVLRSIQKTLKKEQIDGIQEQIDALFDERVAAVMKKAAISSRAELEGILSQPKHPRFPAMLAAWRELVGTAPSTSLVESAESFSRMALASEYLRAKASEPKGVDRVDLLAAYRRDAASYDVPLEVQWQQIVVRHAAHGGEEAAREHMLAALKKLRNGSDFAAVAREHSDGPTAEDGGRRGWIERDSLVDSEIEEALFDMKPGTFSTVFERDGRYEIVRVEKRRGGHRRPFEEVQDEIRERLLKESQFAARQDALKKMRQDVEVVVMGEQDKA